MTTPVDELKVYPFDSGMAVRYRLYPDAIRDRHYRPWEGVYIHGDQTDRVCPQGVEGKWESGWRGFEGSQLPL